MKSKLKAVASNGHNIEALAAEVRIKRQNDCSNALNKVLAEHDCQFSIVVQVGDKAILLDQVLTLPVQLLVTAK